jgi:hypothetical protein
MPVDTTSEPPVINSPARLGATGFETRLNTDGNDDDSNDAVAAELPVAAGLSAAQWVEIAQRSHHTSKTWFDGSVQGQVRRNYAHFHGRHAPGSKYLHEFYRLRSQFFRPKTRAMVRRAEAAMAVALFGTADLLTTDPWDDSDENKRQASEIARVLLQYRLERTIPWFQTMVGAAQEAQIHGRPIAELDWRYRTREQDVVRRNPDTGKPEIAKNRVVIEDRPWIELVPIEMLRFDPAADWRDPIGTSPYLIREKPMYVGDVKDLIRQANAAYGGEWYIEPDDASWWTWSHKDTDGAKQARQNGQVDPHNDRRGVPDFEVVWIHRHFVRYDGVDYVYDMIDTRSMLSIPRPVAEVYPHLDDGERPFVMGTAAVEAHKVIPTAPAGMVSDMQQEINESANLRIDGIKTAVLGRWLMRRGAQLDAETLKYGVANSVIATEDVNRDLRELKQQDIPQSAFAEADRLNIEFDELAGNFSAASVGSNRQLNETVGGMNLLSGDAAQVKEYEIRTLVETFVEPILNQLYRLEQFYETDEELLQDVVVRTNMPLERVLELLDLRIRVRVNVGFNATSPERRIQRISLGVSTVAQLAPEAQQGINSAEIVKEVFGALGFRDGARFYGQVNDPNADPEKQQLMQRVQQLEAMLAGRQLEAESRIEVARIGAESRLQEAMIDQQTRVKIAELEALLEAKRMKLEEFDRQLALDQNDQARRELVLQREALSHEIAQDQREFVLQLESVLRGADGDGGEAEADDGPRDTPGDGDKAGTVSRGQFGLIPFAEG